MLRGNCYWGRRWAHRPFDGLEQTYRLLDTAVAGLRDREE